nr:unnamed protein product [Callosobruchus analis]
MNYLGSVQKLVGRENFDEWCSALENIFVLEGLAKCLDGTERDSVLVAKAKAKLILTIDPSLYLHIKDVGTCKEVWEKLCKLYQDTGFTRKIGLLRNLISLRLETCTSMENYIGQVIETSQKLIKTGFSIDGEWVGSLLLAGLPERYAPMLMAIEHAAIWISADSIKSKLLDMEVDGTNAARKGAFATKHSNNGGSFAKQPRGGGKKTSNVKPDDFE